MVHVALEAAEVLAQEDIDTEVVDLRTLMPLDREAVLATATKTGKVILLHEDTLTGGLGGELAGIISEHAFEYLDGPLVRIAPPDTPVPYSPPLEKAFLPNAEKVVEKARLALSLLILPCAGLPQHPAGGLAQWRAAPLPVERTGAWYRRLPRAA